MNNWNGNGSFRKKSRQGRKYLPNNAHVFRRTVNGTPTEKYAEYIEPFITITNINNSFRVK